MWYPFRSLNQGGVSVATTSLVVYLVAIALGLITFFDVYRRQFRWRSVLLLLAAVFGWCNYSYTWAVSEGQVVRCCCCSTCRRCGRCSCRG